MFMKENFEAKQMIKFCTVRRVFKMVGFVVSQLSDKLHLRE